MAKLFFHGDTSGAAAPEPPKFIALGRIEPGLTGAAEATTPAARSETALIWPANRSGCASQSVSCPPTPRRTKPALPRNDLPLRNQSGF